MKNIIKCIVVCFTIACVSGCEIFFPDTNPRNYQKTTTSVLLIGANKAYNGWTCMGVGSDLANAYDIFQHYSYDITTLTDTNATAKSVLDGIERVCQNKLAIIYYSGHGGTYNTQNPMEEDGCDEFLVLYDYSVWDNDIWERISNAKGDVVLIFDCCHSETMFQMSKDCNMKRNMDNIKLPFKLNSCQSRILCWSACGDKEYSYSDRSGGFFTQTIHKSWKSLTRKEDNTTSYYDLFDSVRNSWFLTQSQEPKETVINNFPVNNMVFQ